MNDWMDQAACRGANTEVFFPGKSDDWQVPVAVCNRCPVVHPCAVWGHQEGIMITMIVPQCTHCGQRLGVGKDRLTHAQPCWRWKIRRLRIGRAWR